MTDKDKQVAENIKLLLPRLSDREKEIFMAYGEGMACRAARNMPRESGTAAEEGRR